MLNKIMHVISFANIPGIFPGRFLCSNLGSLKSNNDYQEYHSQGLRELEFGIFLSNFYFIIFFFLNLEELLIFLLTTLH